MDFIDIINKFPEKKVLVVGDIILDKYTHGKLRKSPEAPVFILKTEKNEYRLGGAANVANNIATLGGQVFLMGLAGTDETFNILKNLLNSYKDINFRIFQDQNRPTSIKTRYLCSEYSQQLIRVDNESIEKINSEIEQEVIRELKLILPQYDAVIFSDYKKGFLTENLCQTIIRENKPVFVDLKPENLDYFKGAYLIKPNLSTAEQINGFKLKSFNEEDLNEFGKAFLEKTQAKYALITLGRDGMLILDYGFKIIPTFAQEVFDVSGAGDTTLAALTLSNLSGANIYDSAIIANHAAGIKVTKKGTAPVYIKELIEALRRDE